VTDQHWDPTYTSSGNKALSCGDSTPETGLGPLGDYRCDAPWTLIMESLNAMKDIKSDPDFIIWTGDNTPHIWDENILNLDQVKMIIGNLTEALDDTFPDITVYPAIGNHDWSPKNQLPPHEHFFYGNLSEMWKMWLPNDQENVETFVKGGYFSMKAPSSDLQMLVLNTNLYYESNNLTKNEEDPAGQFKWLEDKLSAAKSASQKVVLVGHIAPGMFEKHRSKYWFYPNFNKRFNDILRSHSSVIGSAHFSHHHTDSLRLLYSENGEAIVSLLLAPAVTPWETTLAGVIGGAANNPSIRLIEYDRTTGEVLDIHQHYLNLTEANIRKENGQDPVWELAYKGTEYFQTDDMGTASLNAIAQKMVADDEYFQKYYSINGVLYDPEETCTFECKYIHYCAITEVEYDGYEGCVNRLNNNSVPCKPQVYLTILSAIIAITMQYKS